jgi:hypothetical protein
MFVVHDPMLINGFLCDTSYVEELKKLNYHLDNKVYPMKLKLIEIERKFHKEVYGPQFEIWTPEQLLRASENKVIINNRGTEYCQNLVRKEIMSNCQNFFF